MSPACAVYGGQYDTKMCDIRVAIACGIFFVADAICGVSLEPGCILYATPSEYSGDAASISMEVVRRTEPQNAYVHEVLTLEL